MADYVTKVRTADGDKQIDYNALANLPDLTVYATKEEVNAVSTDYEATIKTTDWSESTNNAFMASVTVTGIQASDKPIVDLKTSGLYTNKSNYEAAVDAFSKIAYIETAANTIKCYTAVGDSKPTANIPLKIKVVR